MGEVAFLVDGEVGILEFRQVFDGIVFKPGGLFWSVGDWVEFGGLDVQAQVS